jgi:radical SAM protein with 4Fe4S-binding SPASM domain
MPTKMIFTNETLPAMERFARLADNVTLHISPTYGYVQHTLSGESAIVHQGTKDVLLACDGTKRLRDILNQLHNISNKESWPVKTILELVNLTSQGFLIMDSEAYHVPPKVTGSPKIHYPLNLQVELTVNCNLRCFYCYREAQPYPQEQRLTTDELYSILATLRNHGLESLELTGGEPMLHPDFDSILQFCGNSFPLVAILTNGTLLTEQRINAMLPFRQKMVVSISLDGSTSDLHDQRRGMAGAFTRTTQGIRRLSEQGFLTRVTMVVDETNWDDVERTLLLAKSLGATVFAYSPLLPLGRGKDKSCLWQNHDAYSVSQQEQKLRTKYAGFMQVLSDESVFNLHEPGGCGAGYRTYTMDPMGYIRPCVTFDANVAVFGSLRTQTPEEVFGNPLANAFATLTPPQLDVCSKCDYHAFCQNCQLRALVATSEWIPEAECTWLQQPLPNKWLQLVRQSTMKTA